MKEFSTITEKEILELAYRALLDKVVKEYGIADEYKVKHGREDKLAITRAQKYEKQADEILDRLFELELAEQAK